MSKRLLLGIDVGTSACKIAFFDFEGQVVASHTASYSTHHRNTACVEQDADEWWNSICYGVAQAIHDFNIDSNEIAAIGVDGTSWACIPVDNEGNVLRKVMLWMDRRAEKQAQWMRDKLGQQALLNVCGNPVDPAYIVPKILWIKENEPDVYLNTYKFLQSNSYIVYKLTCEYSQDYSQGYGFHFFNITKGAWDSQIADGLGVSLDHMPEFFHSHQIVGTVTLKAAKETGLMPGIPVVAGGLDAACCALGAGVVKAGQTQEQGGQSGGMGIQVASPVIHPKLILGYHVVPNQWLLQGGTVGGGGTLRWFNEQLGFLEQTKGLKIGKSAYQVMSDEAASIKPGSEGLLFLPYMAGERSPIWNSRARGVFFGLSYQKTRAHLIRSIMEGVAFSLNHNILTAEEKDVAVESMNSVGGSANSHVWTQIKADVTGKPINVPSSDHATALGAAMLAGVGVGVYRDFEQAVKSTIRIERRHIPDYSVHRSYKEYYQLYLELYEKLKSSYDTLYHLVNES